MAQFTQTEAHVLNGTVARSSTTHASRQIIWLQGITVLWMLVECGVSLYGAVSARSPVLLTFGADSFVELLSAAVVVLAILPSFPLTRDQATRSAGILLFVLAGAVAVIAVLALVLGVAPETSCSGIWVTLAALVVMPILAWMKRRIARTTNNRALAADAVESATCAYLAAVTLAGLVTNAIWHIHWVDSTAALLAVPILIIEGRHALRGENCACS